MKRVVVTGLGVVSPVGNDVGTFWKSIKSGTCGIDFITRFDTTDFKVKIAAEVKDFKANELLDRNEVRRSDLYTQYALVAAAEAVKDSEIAGNVAPERLGVYVGSGIGGMLTFENEAKKLHENGPRKVSPFFIPMMIGNIAAGTIAIKYQALGACLPVVTACSTANNAIGEATRAIRHGYADAIIAGGAEAAITPLSVAGFTNCMALSQRNEPNDSSTPFDKRRDGFVIGEGGAILVLEEYEHAVNRGAKIYAEVCGYGNSCDAFHITAPHEEGLGAVNAIKQALSEANIETDKIYINAHGTSTPLNDKTETLAIKTALGEKAYKAKVSSTKSMTGHCLGAAGGVEAIATILALREQIVPPTIGYKEKDEECDLDYVPNVAQPYSADLGLSISCGFGGHNSVLAFKLVRS